jgi:hypothetical protein
LNRVAAIILLICFLGLGSGALNYVHQMQHRREDAIVDAKLRAAGLPVYPHHHDDSNCELCAQLHMQYVPIHCWTPLLICLGLFIAFLTLIDEPLISRQAPARIDCRGPPLV